MNKKQKILFFCGIILLLLAYGISMIAIFIKIDQIRAFKSKILLQESQKELSAKKSFAIARLSLLLEANDESYLIAGEKAQEAGYINIAKRDYKKINSVEGLTRLGNLYLKKNNYIEAEKVFQKALGKKEGLAVLIGLGETFLKEGKAESAKEIFNRALLIEATNGKAIYGNDITNLIIDEQVLVKSSKSYSTDIQVEKIIQSPTLSTRINLLFDYLKRNNYPQLAFNFLVAKEREGELDRDGCLMLANEYFLQKNYEKSYQYLLSAKAKDAYYPQTYQHLIEVGNLIEKTEEVKNYRDFLKEISWE